ncbi:TerB N-terminal domain-containing protein [Kribbella sp. NPDC051620]|uniref:tellurite resistance TerB family protein n=1 Tax=Kribbella sp. NPDC051620 TaxID=3364120 RepID=UPI0037A43391
MTFCPAGCLRSRVWFRTQHPRSKGGRRVGLLDRLRKSVPQAPIGQGQAGSLPTSPPAVHWLTRHAHWVGPGAQTSIGRVQLPGGMLYVGQGLTAPAGMFEPALINPSLKLNHSRPDFAGTSMGYWPSYHEIAPEARAAYLHWLATGRNHPSAYIGYVFLYYYGIERRVLVDIANDPTLAWELPQLRGEVQRLLSIYGANDSFNRYATRFLGLLDVLTPTESQALPPLTREDRWQPPPSLLVQLGTFASSGQPIPGDWALAWAWYHPDVSLRTAATRCTDEFVTLFKARYAAKYKAGLVVRPGQTTVGLEYYAASQGIPSATLTTNIPNVFDDLGARRQLASLAHAAMDDLEPYSRYLGRNPEGRGTVAAAALLPRELLGQPSGEVGRLRSWATDLADTRRVVSGDVLLARWPIKSPERMAKQEAVALAQLLAQFDLAIEPDIRLGGPAITPATPVVLFHATDDPPNTATASYAAATTLLHLATAVSAADGTISEAEQTHLVSHLKSSLQLTAGERTRLEAHLLWLTASDIKLTGLKRRIEALNRPQREALAELLVSVAAADGVISPDEVASLTKIFRLLSFDPSEVHSRLHAHLSGGTSHRPEPATGPVTVRPAGVPDAGYPIQEPEAVEARHRRTSGSDQGITLDLAAIEAKFAETAEVSALLTDIFSEDQPETITPKATTPVDLVPSDAPSIAGLDAIHSTILRRLASRDAWTRGEFEEVAAQYGVMPDGALDTLNEAALDATDEPFVEDDGNDTLTINDFARQELLA